MKKLILILFAAICLFSCKDDTPLEEQILGTWTLESTDCNPNTVEAVNFDGIEMTIYHENSQSTDSNYNIEGMSIYSGTSKIYDITKIDNNNLHLNFTPTDCNRIFTR